MPKIILVPNDENMANARIMDAAGSPALFSAVNSVDFVAYYATGLSVVAQTAPESGATSEDVTITNFVVEGGVATITIGAPPEYAGTHTAAVADLLDGPVNIVPAAVAEAAGVYTATPGLWITGEGDPAIFTYEWRSGSTTWAEADGVSVDGLSFTPVDQELTFDLRGLQLYEAAANIAGTRANTVTARAARELIAVNYSPTRLGTVKSTIADNAGYLPKVSVFIRYRPRVFTAVGGTQTLFGGRSMTYANFRERQGRFDALDWTIQDPEVGVFTGYAVTNHPSFIFQPSVGWSPGNWYSLLFSADRMAGLPGGYAVMAAMNKTTVVQGHVATPAPDMNLVMPRWLGTRTLAWDSAHLADGDFAPFVAIFEDHAFDPTDAAIWDEVFDPTDDHNFRPEYLDGSKITVGGVTPTVVLRGAGLLFGENAVPDGPAWTTEGVLQEPVFAP